MRPLLRNLAPVVLAASLASCADAFVPASQITSLRILAVKNSSPYAKPGDELTFEMLYYDGSSRAFDDSGKRKRDVQVLWIGGCHNPEGDLYFGCFPQIARNLSQMAAMAPAGASGAPGAAGGAGTGQAAPQIPARCPLQGTFGLFGCGPRFRLDIPEDIVSRRPKEVVEALRAEGNEPYGLSYVFYAACGGDWGPANAASSGFPIGCYDPVTKEPLGADDFVVGYTPVYTYEKFANSNPTILGASFEYDKGGFSDPDSMKRPCAMGCPDKTACGASGLCIPAIPHCDKKKLLDCDAYKLKVKVDNSVIEKDEAAPPVDGRKPDEVIWGNFLSSDGAIERDLILYNDANKGWNDDNAITWRPPNAAAGEVRIWAIVRDNRGGTAWWWQDILVQ